MRPATIRRAAATAIAAVPYISEQPWWPRCEEEVSHSSASSEELKGSLPQRYFSTQNLSRKPWRDEERDWLPWPFTISDRSAAKIRQPDGILIVCALHEEAQGLINRLHLSELWRHDRGRQSLFQGHLGAVRVRIAVTGVLEHNATGMLTRLLLWPGEPPPRVVINFGCVGAYEGRKLRIGDAFFVTEARHFDVDVPEPDPFDVRSFKLLVPKSEAMQDIVCTTGARFTRDQPGCHCEDMELYALASLCEVAELPLLSMKYVANFCNESGAEHCMAHFQKVRWHADDRLMAFLGELTAAWAVGNFGKLFLDVRDQRVE